MKIIKSHIKLSLILTFFAGWYIGLWVENWAFVTMSFDVPAINLLTTAVTLGVTVYVAKIIQKSVQDRKSQNQLLIQRIDRIEKLVDEIDHTTSVDGFSYIGLQASIKNLYMSLNRVINEIHRLYPEIKKQVSSKQALLNVRELENVATFTVKNNSQIRISADKFFYSQPKRTEVNSSLSSLRDKLFDLQIEVNGQ